MQQDTTRCLQHPMLPWQPTWGGAGMGFSTCLPCKQDLGEAPSLRSMPRPGGSMQVLQHAHVRCTRFRLSGGRQGTNMRMLHTCICCTNASAALKHMPPPCTCCTHAYATMHMLQPCKCCTHAHAAHMHLPQACTWCTNASAAPTVMQVNLA